MTITETDYCPHTGDAPGISPARAAHWTAEPPTVPGLYFVRCGWGVLPVRVYLDGDRLLYAGPHVFGAVSGTVGAWKWWSEPIQPPEPGHRNA